MFSSESPGTQVRGLTIYSAEHVQTPAVEQLMAKSTERVVMEVPCILPGQGATLKVADVLVVNCGAVEAGAFYILNPSSPMFERVSIHATDCPIKVHSAGLTWNQGAITNSGCSGVALIDAVFPTGSITGVAFSNNTALAYSQVGYASTKFTFRSCSFSRSDGTAKSAIKIKYNKDGQPGGDLTLIDNTYQTTSAVVPEMTKNNRVLNASALPTAELRERMDRVPPSWRVLRRSAVRLSPSGLCTVCAEEARALTTGAALVEHSVSRKSVVAPNTVFLL